MSTWLKVRNRIVVVRYLHYRTLVSFTLFTFIIITHCQHCRLLLQTSWCDVACARLGEHLHHLANTFECSMSAGNVSFCQITLDVVKLLMQLLVYSWTQPWNDVAEPESSADKDGKGGGLSGEGIDSPDSPGMVAASVRAGQAVDTGTYQWHQDLYHDQVSGFVAVLLSHFPHNTPSVLKSLASSWCYGSHSC